MVHSQSKILVESRQAAVQDSRLQGVAKGHDPAAHFVFTRKALETQAAEVRDIDTCVYVWLLLGKMGLL